MDAVSPPTDHDPDAPPAPPRAITANALKRSWHERRVRLWMILAVLITLTTAYFAYRDITLARAERHLINEGVVVPAKIIKIDTIDRENREFTRDEAHQLHVRYTTSGQTLETDLDLPGRAVGRIRVGQMIDIRMDANDPTSVTLQTQPRPWSAALAVVLLLAPVSILLIAIVFVQRQRVLGVWKNGESAEAVVVDSHRSGIAPKSKIVRFTLTNDEDDQRVFSTLYPNSAGDPAPGESFWIVMPKDSPAKAIVAELYS